MGGAAFSLEAHASGVALPTGKFTDLKSTLKKQLDGYIKKVCEAGDPMALGVTIELTDEQLNLFVCSSNFIKTLALRPVIEDLNNLKEGLGWFVYDTLDKALGQDRFPAYKPSFMGCLAEMMWFDPSMTDAEYAQALRDDYGSEAEGGSDAEVIAEFGFGNGGPSRLLSEYGGHAWMLGAHGRSKPKPLSLRTAKRMLKSAMPERLRELLAATLDLQKESQREDSNMRLAEAYEGDSVAMGYGPPNPIGSSCILVWDSPELTHELLQHFEESEMNGGEETDVHMVFKADASDAIQVRQLVKSFQDFVARYAAISKVLQFFPKAKHASDTHR